jgi:hypothetical protein
VCKEEVAANNRKWTTSKRSGIAILSEEAKIMAAPITEDMDPLHRAWLENKKMIHDRESRYSATSCGCTPLLPAALSSVEKCEIIYFVCCAPKKNRLTICVLCEKDKT